MAGREEQETQISYGRLDDHLEIWTNNVVDVRKLEKEDRAKRTHPADDVDLTEYLENGFGVTYQVSMDDANPLGVFKRKTKKLSDEERAALGERLRAGRGSA